MIYSKHYNSPEQRKKRSDKGSHAANVKWERYHDALACEPIREDLPEDLYRLTFENLLVPDKKILLFHPGTRINNFHIDVNGDHWKTCGINEALELLRKSFYRIARHF